VSDGGGTDPRAADLVAAGLLDPAAPDAAERRALLEYLVDELGVSLAECARADEEGGLVGLAAFHRLRPDDDRYTLAEVAAHAGMPESVALQLWRSAGFADPRPFERAFGRADAEAFGLFGALAADLGPDAVLQFVRVAGEAVGRIAEAEIAQLRSHVEGGGFDQAPVEIARAYAEWAERTYPELAAVIDTLHRRHLLAVARRYRDVEATASVLNVVPLAVGFADLAGYTGMWNDSAVREMASVLTRFEALTAQRIAAAGANVVKRIGDAVMFATSAPGVACALAIDLVEACAAAGLPKLRVGVAFGEVMVRHGDLYGTVVNLAARLVAAADAGTAVTDRDMRDRLERVRGGYSFVPSGRLRFDGFAERVEVFQLLRG